MGNSIVRTGQSSNSSPTAGVSEETVQKIKLAEANGQQVSPALAQQFMQESLASEGATNLTFEQNGDTLSVTGRGVGKGDGILTADVDLSQTNDLLGLATARTGLAATFGSEFTTGSGRGLNLSFMEAQRNVLNERLSTPIEMTAAFRSGEIRGFNNAAFHARDRIAGINNDIRNNRIAIATNEAVYARDQAASRLTTLDKVQLGLDAVGMSEIPILSQAADLGSAGISVYNGDWLGAGLSAGSAIPIFGKAFEGTRTARMLDRISDLEVGGLSAKRIVAGTNEKVAVIGRSMGNDAIQGVRDYAEALKAKGIDVELFDGNNIPRSARKEFERLTEGGRWLTNNDLVKTEMYQANKTWANKIQQQGYTIIDIGNPHNQGFSPFYAIEKLTIFKKGQ